MVYTVARLILLHQQYHVNVALCRTQAIRWIICLKVTENLFATLRLASYLRHEIRVIRLISFVPKSQLIRKLSQLNWWLLWNRRGYHPHCCIPRMTDVHFERASAQRRNWFHSAFEREPRTPDGIHLFIFYLNQFFLLFTPNLEWIIH